jgi:hypothetical protein
MDEIQTKEYNLHNDWKFLYILYFGILIIIKPIISKMFWQ